MLPLAMRADTKPSAVEPNKKSALKTNSVAAEPKRINETKSKFSRQSKLIDDH